MLITALKQQVKNPGRVSVFVDGKYSFSLSLDEVVNEGIKKDLEISEPDLKRLKKISADGKTKTMALNWLLNRPHSIREFHDYMRRKKTEPELVSRLEDDFTLKGYLNDANYARWLVDLRQRAGKSNRAIKAELFKKGVSRQIVDEALENQSGSEKQRLKDLADKKLKLPRYASDPKKLAQYLMRQGFDYQLVKDTLKIKVFD